MSREFLGAPGVCPWPSGQGHLVSRGPSSVRGCRLPAVPRERRRTRPRRPRSSTSASTAHRRSAPAVAATSAAYVVAHAALDPQRLVLDLRPRWVLVGLVGSVSTSRAAGTPAQPRPGRRPRPRPSPGAGRDAAGGRRRPRRGPSGASARSVPTRDHRAPPARRPPRARRPACAGGRRGPTSVMTRPGARAASGCRPPRMPGLAPGRRCGRSSAQWVNRSAALRSRASSCAWVSPRAALGERWGVSLERRQLGAVAGHERGGTRGRREPDHQAAELGSGRVHDVLVGVRGGDRRRRRRGARVEVAAAEHAGSEEAGDAAPAAAARGERRRPIHASPTRP